MEPFIQDSGWRMLIMETIGMTLTGERGDTKVQMEHLLVSVSWKTSMASVEQVLYVCIDYTKQVYSYLYICMFNYSDIYWMCTENDLLENSSRR